MPRFHLSPNGGARPQDAHPQGVQAFQGVRANILSIAGSDPSGGAGIQADLKAFVAAQSYGMAALTALTVQNTRKVSALQILPADFVAAQIRAVFADITVDAVKIGMIASAEIARSVAAVLKEVGAKTIVLDPVMIAKSGDRLIDDEAIAVLRDHLLPLARVLTPNLPEAAALIGGAAITRRQDMPALAERLCALGCQAVVLKGGHLPQDESPDYLYDSLPLAGPPAGARQWFEARRLQSHNTHGTGCNFSSTLAALLGRGCALPEAVKQAKAAVARGIKTAESTLRVGGGHGPIDLFAPLSAASSSDFAPGDLAPDDSALDDSAPDDSAPDDSASSKLTQE